MVRSSSARVVAGALAAGVLVSSCGMVSPRSPETSPTPIYGARTGDGGRSLILGYEDGGCGGAPRPETRQSPTAVTITVVLARPAPAGGACTADSVPRILVIALAAPLGNRRVVDGSTQKMVGLFDGSRLLHPTVFPDALSVRSDLAPYAGSSSHNWTQIYSRATPQQRCSTSPTVDVTQGTAVSSAANDLFTQVQESHEVAGTRAQYLQDPSDPGSYYLEWSPASRPGWKVLLQSEQACRGTPGLTSTDLLRFADSFR